LKEQFPAGPLDSSQSFVVHATAEVYIPSAGTWTFGTTSDDGAQLTVAGNTVLDDNTPNSPTDTLGTYNFPSAGEYPLDLLYYQYNGGASVELYATPGNWTSFGATTTWELVGDTADGGLCVTNIGSPTGYTVAAVAGHNLYLVNSNPPIATGNYTDVTVAAANFTPEIAASAALKLQVTGAGNAISGAIGGTPTVFSASTNNGNITTQFTNANAALLLGTVNAGNAQIQLAAQASIFPAANLPANTTNLVGDRFRRRRPARARSGRKR
jgi:hypothetical protein